MTDTYDSYLKKLKENHHKTAETAIRNLYELLKKEDSNLSKNDMYDRILKDCLVIWQKQTILNNMPDELKDTERQESGRKGQKIRVATNGSVATESVANSNNFNNDDKEPQKVESGDWPDMSSVEELRKQLQQRQQEVNTLQEKNRKQDNEITQLSKTVKDMTFEETKQRIANTKTGLEYDKSENPLTDGCVEIILTEQHLADWIELRRGVMFGNVEWPRIKQQIEYHISYDLNGKRVKAMEVKNAD